MNNQLIRIIEALKNFGDILLKKISGHTIDNTPTPPIRNAAWFGIIVVFVFFGIFFIWSVFAPLETAALAPGKIVSSTNRKTIQHLEGGIIRKIYVQEGSKVKAGDPLIKLDDTQARTRYDLLNSQLIEFYATEARLVAERDEQQTITFPEVILKQSDNPEIKKVMSVQETIFNNDKTTFSDHVKILQQRILQLEKQIEGYTAQIKSNEEQSKFITKELEAFKELDKKQYAEKPRIWALERESAKLMGNRGELIATTSQAEQKIGETQQEVIALKNTTRKEILDKLTDTQRRLIDTLEYMKSTEDILRRTIITAPHNGVVMNLQEHTISGVIGAGKDIMDIVPSDDALIVEARISPLDIDIVHPGLPAKVKLIALKQRNMPSIDGTVTDVSADSFFDSQANSSYYRARIMIAADQLKKLPNIKLYPGMPVEVMIIVDKRTAWQYFITPIKDSYNKAFREQ
jgi:HlyD family secretion protein/epimerase transport system membrane fusion protein